MRKVTSTTTHQFNGQRRGDGWGGESHRAWIYHWGHYSLFSIGVQIWREDIHPLLPFPLSKVFAIFGANWGQIDPCPIIIASRELVIHPQIHTIYNLLSCIFSFDSVHFNSASLVS